MTRLVVIVLSFFVMAVLGSSIYSAQGPLCSSYHVVDFGETLSEIAAENGTKSSQLAELNNIENKDLIKQGQKICLSEPVKKCGEFREVKSGDTLSLIALSLGMEPPYGSALKIAKASDIKEPDRIEVGDKVCIDKTFLETVTVLVPAEKTPKVMETEKQKEEPKVQVKPEETKKEEDETEEDDMRTGIAVSPFLSYSRIDAVDVFNNSKGGVLSRPDYGVELKLMQVWGDYFTSEVIAQIERRKYFTNSNRTFEHHGGQMLNLGAGMGFRPFRRLELKAKVLYGDEFYFRAPDTGSLAIDRTRTVKGDLGVYFDVMRSKKGSAGLGGGVKVLASSYIDAQGANGYDTKAGLGYFGTAYMKHEFKYIILEESFTYESLNKDTELFKQTHSAVYLKGGVTLLF